MDTTKKIYQIGMIRSGSTLVYQVLKMVFPSTHVIKQCHFLIDMSDPIVVTYRDFRDVLVSTWRTFIASKQGRPVYPITEKEIKETYEFMKPYLKAMNRGKELYGDTALWLKYEDFFDNFDFLFSEIETFFNIQIEPHLRKLIKAECSLERNKERSRGFRDFNEYGKEHEIHGDHIRKGSVGGWREEMAGKYYPVINETLKNELKEWGYE